MTNLPFCTKCGKSYPLIGAPFLCDCGGVFDFSAFPDFLPSGIDVLRKDLWRYGRLFNLGKEMPIVTLGEGNTPLVETEHSGHSIWLKLENQNPTGSYKDRGSAVLASFLLSRGVGSIVEDSSGNAGASIAAYAARAGIRARIFVPESASGPKRRQIEEYGAELVSIPGPRAEAAKAVRKAVGDNDIYASHAYMPFGLLGIATIAYEIVEELGGNAPGTIMAPVGHGGLLYGVIKGFKALKKAAVIEKEPFYAGIQSGGCAPIFMAYQNHEYTLREPKESDTIAEGVRVRNPVRGEGILREISNSRGAIYSVDEADLIKAYDAIARQGFFVEPTSALPWAALDGMMGKVPEPVVMILTGSGYKTKF